MSASRSSDVTAVSVCNQFPSAHHSCIDAVPTRPSRKAAWLSSAENARDSSGRRNSVSTRPARSVGSCPNIPVTAGDTYLMVPLSSITQTTSDAFWTRVRNHFSRVPRSSVRWATRLSSVRLISRASRRAITTPASNSTSIAIASVVVTGDTGKPANTATTQRNPDRTRGSSGAITAARSRHRISCSVSISSAGRQAARVTSAWPEAATTRAGVTVCRPWASPAAAKAAPDTCTASPTTSGARLRSGRPPAGRDRTRTRTIDAPTTIATVASARTNAASDRLSPPKRAGSTNCQTSRPRPRAAAPVSSTTCAPRREPSPRCGNLSNPAATRTPAATCAKSPIRAGAAKSPTARASEAAQAACRALATASSRHAVAASESRRERTTQANAATMPLTVRVAANRTPTLAASAVPEQQLRRRHPFGAAAFRRAVASSGLTCARNRVPESVCSIWRISPVSCARATRSPRG